MRKLLVFCLLILAIFLAAPSVKGQPKIPSLLVNSSYASYSTFIDTFRASLPVDPIKSSVYNKPLLCTNATVRGSSLYTQVQLTNSNGYIIRLAIDVTNVYVLGFYTPQCSASYFFNDDYSEASKMFVFKDSTQNTLPFDGTYPGLEKYKAFRSSLSLSLPNLDRDIITLYKYSCNSESSTSYNEVAKVMLVIIQVISEAARFHKIQFQVQKGMPPTPTQQSLENNWGKLSKQIQIAETNKGSFENDVWLDDSQWKSTIKVANVNSEFAKTVKLLLNKQSQLHSTMSSDIYHDRYENYATM